MGEAIKKIRLEPVVDRLPGGFEGVRAEARAEGHRFLDRLADDWAAGAMRFDGSGERLLGAYLDGKLAGIGGLTIEPADPNALRMRRFYVRPSHRRIGVGRELALALLDHANGLAKAVTINAQRASFPFWESLGFVRVTRDGLTHALDLRAVSRGLLNGP